MSGKTRVTVITPAGTGAIATVEVCGKNAWAIASLLFQPAGKALPQSPERYRFWFGTLGRDVGDEVILSVTAIEPDVRLEVHCHGGRKVVQWVVHQFAANGCVEVQPTFNDADPLQLLTRAPTVRTASILLDQANGAFARAVQRILRLLTDDPPSAIGPLNELARFAPIGRHLVEPWKVVIAGPPNVGKSSLANAMAGYQRAIVSEIAGTTRDLVTVQLAFDGWPVELTDTAGLRDAEGLEGEGIGRTKRVLSEADLVLWVLDSSEQQLIDPDPETSAITCRSSMLRVLNKSDKLFDRPSNPSPGTMPVSAITGAGIPELVKAIGVRLVPNHPSPGAAVPFTPGLADRVTAAHAALLENQIGEAVQLLSETGFAGCELRSGDGESGLRK